MLKHYLPKKFCRDFVQLKGNSLQLAMFMATIKGLKPLMDDWVKVDRYPLYEKLCKKYGLFVKPDAVFKIMETKHISSKTIGKNILTTTHAIGSIFNKNSKEGEVHVFISKSKKSLEEGFLNGWYPLIIQNRVLDRPLADAFKFGLNLGYPSCCVNFFQKYNNWLRYNYLFEIFRNTPKSKYNFLCNPFNKNTPHSYIYHMPCSYNCQATIQWAREIRNAIRKEEPEFVRLTDRYLKMPFLIFYEKKCYAFDGQIKDGKLRYNDIFFTGGRNEDNIYEKIIRKGDCLFIEENTVIILKKQRKIAVIKCQKRNFASENPFIIQFN